MAVRYSGVKIFRMVVAAAAAEAEEDGNNAWWQKKTPAPTRATARNPPRGCGGRRQTHDPHKCATVIRLTV